MNSSLKTVRLFHNMSQKKLADELDISPAHLCGIEKGKKQPTLEILTGYARVFGLPLSSLLYFAEQCEQRSEKRTISNKVFKMLEWLEVATRT